MNAAYPYTVEPQESGHYLIQIIDLDDAFTQGATMARSNPTLKQLEQAAALGKRLMISLA